MFLPLFAEFLKTLRTFTTELLYNFTRKLPPSITYIPNITFMLGRDAFSYGDKLKNVYALLKLTFYYMENIMYHRDASVPTIHKKNIKYSFLLLFFSFLQKRCIFAL